MLGAPDYRGIPMASSYQALTREIEALKKRAEAARKQEAAELVALMKSGIELYGLTAQDLGLAQGDKPAKKAAATKKAATATKVKAASTPAGAPAVKYADGAGHSWSGRGPRPGWVKAAIDAGQTLDDLLATAVPKPAPNPKAAGKKAGKSAKKAAAKTSKAAAVDTATELSKPASNVKYKDNAGNAWSGRGPKPGWLRSALESGKSLEDFLA
jgi:DNA-binding protein H-NS